MIEFLKKIKVFLQRPCKNCREWKDLDFCKNNECKYFN